MSQTAFDGLAVVKKLTSTWLCIGTLGLLTACGGAGSGNASTNNTSSTSQTVSGRLLDEAGKPVADATLDITLQSASENLTIKKTTNAAGEWSAEFPKSFDYPSSFVGTFSKASFRPTPITFSYTNSKVVALSDGNGNLKATALTPEDVIVVESQRVVHLGDASFGGSANSQLQANSSGLSHQWVVKSLNSSRRWLASYDNLCFYFLARGIQINDGNKDTITLGDATSSLIDSPDSGEFGWQRSCFATQGLIPLIAMDQTLEIRSGTRTGSSDYDDFEMVGFYARLEQPNTTTIQPIVDVIPYSELNATSPGKPYTYKFNGGFYPIGTKQLEYDWGDGSPKTYDSIPSTDYPVSGYGQRHYWVKTGTFVLTLQYLGENHQVLGKYTKTLTIL
ncbi:carboxypeptidase-like regulatory domain-containing protein [Limnohabitans sp.]|uniref:carboxypeptidase-like regulatory domain-containing protein n=1 Tax=Limnohabitans sp. TaxID=1907725 RepID=UPI00286F42B5|nr:carboxypeptidase-like regulatory domain-containing protein [Limnohabitans sp.]